MPPTWRERLLLGDLALAVLCVLHKKGDRRRECPFSVSRPTSGVDKTMDEKSGNDPQGSHPKKSDAQPPGSSQVTNPNKEIGDGEEITEESGG